MASGTKKRTVKLEEKKTRLEKTSSFWAGLYIILLFTLHPLIISPKVYYNITITKLYTFYFLFYAFFICIAFLYVAARFGEPPYKLNLKETFKSLRLYEYLLLGYLVILVLSNIFSVDPALSCVGSTVRNEGTITQLAYIGSILMVGRFYKPTERDLLIFCGVAALITAYGICQYYNFDFLHLYDEAYTPKYGPEMKFYGTMSYINVISTYSGLAFLISTVLFCTTTAPKYWVFAPLGWVVFYQMILGNTQSGYVGVLAGFVLCFAFIAKNLRSLGKLFLMGGGCLLLVWLFDASYWPEWGISRFHDISSILPIAALVFLGLAALLTFIRIPLPKLRPKTWRIAWAVVLVILVVTTLVALPVVARLTNSSVVKEAAEILQGNVDDSFGTNRVFIWRRAVSLLTPGRLVLGHGPDMFKPIFGASFLEESIAVNNEVADKAHSEYLQVLFDEGVLGLLLLVAAFLAILWQARKKFDQSAVVAVAAAMVFYLVQATFNYSSPIAHPSMFGFWGILAAMGARDVAAWPKNSFSKWFE